MSNGYDIEIPLESIPKEYHKELFIRLLEWSLRATTCGIIENKEVLEFPSSFNSNPTNTIIEFMYEFKLTTTLDFDYFPYKKSKGKLVFENGILLNKEEIKKYE